MPTLIRLSLSAVVALNLFGISYVLAIEPAVDGVANGPDAAVVSDETQAVMAGDGTPLDGEVFDDAPADESKTTKTFLSYTNTIEKEEEATDTYFNNIYSDQELMDLALKYAKNSCKDAAEAYIKNLIKTDGVIQNLVMNHGYTVTGYAYTSTKWDWDDPPGPVWMSKNSLATDTREATAEIEYIFDFKVFFEKPADSDNNETSADDTSEVSISSGQPQNATNCTEDSIDPDCG